LKIKKASYIIMQELMFQLYISFHLYHVDIVRFVSQLPTKKVQTLKITEERSYDFKVLTYF